jgi:hypothetical protein
MSTREARIALEAAEPPPSPDTGPQTPSGPITLWRFADAPPGLQAVVATYGDGRTGRWIALLPAESVTAWKPDAYSGRPIPTWAPGWERMQQLAYALDHVSEPLYFQRANKEVLVVGCAG